MIHSYTSLNNPIAQIAAAEEFCASVHAYIEDEYENACGGKPPDVEEVHLLNILDALARIGLRFEVAGNDPDVGGYFTFESGETSLDLCFYAYARRVAEDVEENELITGVDKNLSVFELVTLHGCGFDDLVFVPDYDGVASAAYMLALNPGKLPVSS